MLVLEREVEKKVQKYKSDNANLEKNVIKWQEKIILNKIAGLSKKCYDLFNELQMNIAKLKDEKLRKKYEKESYKETYTFLVFVENKVNEDLYCLLVNNVKPFANLINHYSKYCTKYEENNNIELDSEKKLRE